jgi:hypothetical protein
MSSQSGLIGLSAAKMTWPKSPLLKSAVRGQARSDYPPLQFRCHTPARASLRNRFHRSVELECSPIVIDPARLSCHCNFSVHWNSVPSTQMRCMITARRRAKATTAFFIPPGDLHRPGLEPAPLVGASPHYLSRFVEHHSHHLVPAL